MDTRRQRRTLYAARLRAHGPAGGTLPAASSQHSRSTQPPHRVRHPLPTRAAWRMRNRPTGAPKDPMPQELSDSDYRTYVRLSDLAGNYGGPEGLTKKIEKLEADNAEYRQKIKDAEAKVPKDGAVVLTPEQAALWTKVETAAKDAAAVDKLLADAAEADTLRGEIAKRDKAEKRRKAAEAEGVNVDALALVNGADALEYDTGEEADPKDASKKVPAGYVVVDGKKVRLAEHVRTAWPAVADALLAKQDRGNGTGGGISFQPERPAGAKAGPVTEADRRAAVERTGDYNAL